MEFSLFGGALALSRYVPAANVARATRSVLSLVSMRESKVGGAQQAKRRATASNETQVNCARSSQSAPFFRARSRSVDEAACRALVVEAGSGRGSVVDGARCWCRRREWEWGCVCV